MLNPETIATLLMLALACCMPRRAATWCDAAERRLAGFARRRRLAVMLVGLLGVAGSAAVSLLGQMPAPAIHDEFSYLLAADTFASGRLTNPTHPLWIHFESMHVLQQPTYASKYPPGQGLALAAGQFMFGHPIVGVWVSAGLACAALTWMLQAWLPPRWAILGGLLSLVRPGVFSYWSQSYWGGAVAALGGALVFGALPRLVRGPQVHVSLLGGLGLAILANSRPFEGFLVSLPAGAVLLTGLLGRTGPPVEATIRRVALPIFLVLALTGGAMTIYNLRVTGHPLRLPYQVYEHTYAMAPAFLWQRPRPEPMYRHKALRDHNQLAALQYEKQRSFSGLLALKMPWFRNVWGFYLGFLLTIPLVMVPWLLKDRWTRVALLICATLVAGLFVETWAWAHYAAPVTGLVLALVLQGMRLLRLCRWRGRPVGRHIIWAILLLCVALAPRMRDEPQVWSLNRARILAWLQESGERHLVLVRYGPGHSPHAEWVYNAADIDGAQVVWAREMDPARNRELLGYLKGRRPWLLEADMDPPGLTPYLPETET